MKKMICRLTALLLSLFSLVSNAASELQNYVQQCETELRFNASDVPALNCNNGLLFSGGSPAGGLVNDYFIYTRVNDTVDLAVACRWLNNHSGPSTVAGSVELLLHNRQTGSTCFFSAKGTTAQSNQPVSVAIVSPTNFSATHPNADDYWVQPTDLNNLRLPTDQNITSNRVQPFPNAAITDSVQCVGCHVEGPYIASRDIGPFLAQFGLLNNGHDTIADMTSTAPHYHAVGSNPYNNPTGGTSTSVFKAWDSIIYGNMLEDLATGKPVTECSGACHSLGLKSAIGDLFTIAGGIDRLLPSLQLDINDLPSLSPILMPAYDDSSNYHWVNLDTPTNNTPSAGVESENFADAMNHVANSIVPVLFHGADPSNPGLPSSPNCAQPGYDVPKALVAHVVGAPANFAFSTTQMAQLPDRLRTFNLKEGLTCLNSDQEAGQMCHDYAVRYLCSVSFGFNASETPTWSGWYNTDSPSGDGDHEERSRDQTICGGVSPIAIQAQVSVNGNMISVMGPNDRLARFSAYGLTCNASDQVDGQCSNYVVRYDTCTPPPRTTVNRTLTNEDAIAGSKQLTAASGSLVKAQGHNNSWNTQQWAVEVVANTEYVRLRNTGTNGYLNVTSIAEQSAVGTAAFNRTATGEMWIIEPVSNSGDSRLKNLFSGKYLTMADPNSFPSTPDYLPMYSQGLNTSWNTQRWIVQ